MILEAIFLVQLTGTMHECVGNSATGIKYYSTNCSLIGDGTTTNSAAPSPSCPDGYALMSDLMMHPKCARDIIEPIYK